MEEILDVTIANPIVSSGGINKSSTATIMTALAANLATTPVASTPDVFFKEITFKEKVGHGSYGVVYKAVWRGRLVAGKEFGASAEQKAIETEVKQLSRVSHPNIIALYGISSDQQSKYLIMEYAEGGSLHNFLHGKVKPYYSRAHAVSWARQCAKGVAYLHAMKPKPLIHRDLKPLNLLLTNKGRHLKICDFGTVADKSTMMTNNRGSAAWMAPEVFEGSKYTEKCDIFSWAIVLWEVLSRQQPFKEIDNTYSIMWKIHKGERPPLLKNCPESIKNLMTSCWTTAPEKRPSMQYVVNVMNDIASEYPGAEHPLEYEFANQQIISADGSDRTDTYEILDYTSLSSSGNNTTSTQVTPTNLPLQSNTSNSSTPTNVTGSNSSDYFTSASHSHGPTAAIICSNRWGAIPEEEPDSTPTDSFNLTPSTEAARRYATIRNGMIQMASKPMPPLSLDFQANPFGLIGNESGNSLAKSDGKERLTVTDAKPIAIPPTTGGSASKVTTTATMGMGATTATDVTNMNILNSGGSCFVSSANVHIDTESDAELGDDDEESDDADQSLAAMLDQELQPVLPIPNNPESQAIYREHRRLAKEYLRVDEKLYYAKHFKDTLLQSLDPSERQQKQELLLKMRDKDELLGLYNNLKQQLEKLRTSNDTTDASTMLQNVVAQRQMQQTNDAINGSGGGNSNEVVADDGWVMVAPYQNI